ncbi:GNAT family N-acetyltransferase [Kineosporia succinea]|uniref:GNAT superfamily N-acetyltransferase n=1 Tax=Kineosporia succinea TaxID=84632 RepID=A0ABT9NYI7_9ACTN|nr:GNAT family N-acetyltransferase [Kineosporia succinea]MDP9825498.1 GNAT superfamily N-acetyltransferase [Kineosporia succinea]
MKPSSAQEWAQYVGSRVVVRHRAPDGLRDLLGELVSVTPQSLEIDGRGGPVSVDLTSVVAGKPVPPRAARPAPPHLAPSVADLQLTMAKHWQAAEQDWLGGWLLRASGGFTNRANSVLPVGEPGMQLDVAVEEVVDWYSERGLKPVAMLPEPAADDGDADQLRNAAIAFAQAGWTRLPDNTTAVLTGATGELRGLSPRLGGRPLPEGLTLELADEPDPAWLEQYHYRGQAVPEHGVRLLTSAPRQVFVSVRSATGDVVGVARGSLADTWTGLAGMEVKPERRRQGLASALIGTVAEWGWSLGARSLYLQVVESNAGARATYDRAGFAFHHRYDYVTPQVRADVRP